MPEPLAPSPDLDLGAAPAGVEANVESGVEQAPSAVRSRRVPDQVWASVCGVVGVTTGLWITRHAWGPHLIAGGDVTADLIRANFGIAQIVAHGRLDGWFPRFMEGDQEFLFNGPGVTWAIAFLRLLSLGALSNAGALKVLAIGSIAAEPLAVAYLARSFGLNRISAGIAGIISFTATAGYGGSGLEGLFVNGLLSHQLGAIPFFISFGALLRVFDDPSRRRMVVAGTALAALVITHLISVMILAVMFPIALIFRMSASQRSAALRGLGGVLGAGGVAFGIAGFWVVPFLVHRNLHGPVVTWGTDPFDVRIAQILRGQILYEPFIAKLVILAWIVTIVRAAFGHREHVVLLAVPAIYLVIAHVTLSYPGPGDISLQLANRGLAYAGVFALLPVAALVGLIVTRLGDLSGDQYIAILLCAFALVAAVIVTVGHSNEHVAGQLTTPTPALRDAAAELRDIVPSGARFSMTRDYPAEISRVGVIEPERWLAWASGVDTLNAFNPEASNAGAVAYTADGPANNQTIDSWVRALRRLGVSHIVVDKPALDKQMQASALVHQVWTQGPVTIYEVLTDTGGTPPILMDTAQSNAGVAFSQRGPERLQWTINSGQSFTSTIAVAWSPKWHATLDGQGVRVSKTSDGLMQIDIPSGLHQLQLAYRPDAADHIGLLVTLVTLWLLIGRPLRRRWKARKPASMPVEPTALPTGAPETLGAWRVRVFGSRESFISQASARADPGT
ncbi:MAG: hypothetical protein ACLPVY_25790 [Acidimicrobiia bacterium]